MRPNTCATVEGYLSDPILISAACGDGLLRCWAIDVRMAMGGSSPILINNNAQNFVEEDNCETMFTTPQPIAISAARELTNSSLRCQEEGSCSSRPVVDSVTSPRLLSVAPSDKPLCPRVACKKKIRRSTCAIRRPDAHKDKKFLDSGAIADLSSLAVGRTCAPIYTPAPPSDSRRIAFCDRPVSFLKSSRSLRAGMKPTAPSILVAESSAVD